MSDETRSAGEPGGDAAESVRAWLRGWGHEVAAADIRSGRERFDPAMSAFGTHADVVRGRDSTEAEQWSKIWPAIEDFEFRADDAEIIVSPDGTMAVIATAWTSSGIDEAGTRFDRPGRATIVLRRTDRSAPWLGVHTHFSLARGVPASTHGRRTAIR